MNHLEREVIRKLREKGYAIGVFYPEELEKEEISPTNAEALMVEAITCR